MTQRAQPRETIDDTVEAGSNTPSKSELTHAPWSFKASLGQVQHDPPDLRSAESDNTVRPRIDRSNRLLLSHNTLSVCFTVLAVSTTRTLLLLSASAFSALFILRMTAAQQHQQNSHGMPSPLKALAFSVLPTNHAWYAAIARKALLLERVTLSAFRTHSGSRRMMRKQKKIVGVSHLVFGERERQPLQQDHQAVGHTRAKGRLRGAPDAPVSRALLRQVKRHVDPLVHHVGAIQSYRLWQSRTGKQHEHGHQQQQTFSGELGKGNSRTSGIERQVAQMDDDDCFPVAVKTASPPYADN